MLSCRCMCNVGENVGEGRMLGSGNVGRKAKVGTVQLLDDTKKMTMLECKCDQ